MRNQISEKNVLEICSKQYELQSSEKKAQFSKNYIDNYKKKKSYFFLLAYFCHKKGAAVIGPLIFLGNHSYYDIYILQCSYAQIH